VAASRTQTKERLALNIKAFRKRRGFSQERLAEAADLSAQSISDIEGCRTWVSDKTLEKLAEALCVDVFLLFLPKTRGSENALEIFMFDRLMELRSSLKKDIDSRLDHFYAQGVGIDANA